MLTLMLLAFAGVGCSSHPGTPTIAVIQSTGGTESFNDFMSSASQRAKTYGFVLKVSAPQSSADYEVQARLLNDAVQHHVSGIILAPTHQLVLAEGVRRAHAAGIPVVIVDSPIAVQPSEYVTSIGCSDEVIGFMAAQRFAGLHKSLRVLVIGASPTLQATGQREESLRRALQRSSPEVQIVESRYSLSDWARARQTTLDALAADPQINAVFSSDDFSTHGVLAAVRLIRQKRPLTLIAVQSGSEATEAVHAGVLNMALTCDYSTIGQLAMDAMNSALHKLPVDKLIQTEVIQIKGESPGEETRKEDGITAAASPGSFAMTPGRNNYESLPVRAVDDTPAPHRRLPHVPS